MADAKHSCLVPDLLHDKQLVLDLNSAVNTVAGFDGQLGYTSRPDITDHDLAVHAFGRVNIDNSGPSQVDATVELHPGTTAPVTVSVEITPKDRGVDTSDFTIKDTVVNGVTHSDQSGQGPSVNTAAQRARGLEMATNIYVNQAITRCKAAP